MLHLRPGCRRIFTQVLVAPVVEEFAVKMKIARLSCFPRTSLASESQPHRGWDVFFRT